MISGNGGAGRGFRDDRTAVGAVCPISNLGLILIDEEHEGAYKSETMPRYHAREVAAERARLSGASLVLGSATPSLESYLRAQNGEYVLLPLHHRAVAGSILPKVQIADMRAEMQVGNKSVFSRTLDAMLTERTRTCEQAMLFMNRRGYSNFVSCRSCGKAVTCPHCDVSLTLHGKNRLVCHYCGYTIPLMKQCPSCGSPYIAGFGPERRRWKNLRKFGFRMRGSCGWMRIQRQKKADMKRFWRHCKS